MERGKPLLVILRQREYEQLAYVVKEATEGGRGHDSVSHPTLRHTYYRCVLTYPPNEREFWSAERKGTPLRLPITEMRQRTDARGRICAEQRRCRA
jgi:hypothetical protein